MYRPTTLWLEKKIIWLADPGIETRCAMGHGSGLVVSVLAVYSDDTSSNPAGYLNFLHEKMKINEKEAGVGPSLKNYYAIAYRAKLAMFFGHQTPIDSI